MKKLTAMVAALGAACVVMTAPAVASADPNTRQCNAAWAAVKAGKPIPEIAPFRTKTPIVLKNDGTLKVYSETSAQEGLNLAIKNWSEASGGAIKIVQVSAPGPDVVHIYDARKGYFGEYEGNPPRIMLKQGLKDIRLDQQAFVIGHELGHALGLAHSCPNTIMLAGGVFKPRSIVPTILDVQAVRQGKF